MYLEVDMNMDMIRSYYNGLGPLCIHDQILAQQLQADGFPLNTETLKLNVSYVEDEEEVYEVDDDDEESLDLDVEAEDLGKRKAVTELPNLKKRKKANTANDVHVSEYELRSAYDAFITASSDSFTIAWSSIRSVMTSSDEVNQYTGRLGEELIYLHLCRKYEGSNVKVEWVNQTYEMGNPYDIILKKVLPGGVTTDIVQFIEVKATRFQWKPAFEVSSSEWKFAEQHQDKFSIYRVLNVNVKNNVNGEMRVGVVRFDNPVVLVQKGYLKLNHLLSTVH
jgi:hypothetical protein